MKILFSLWILIFFSGCSQHTETAPAEKETKKWDFKTQINVNVDLR